MNTRNTFLFVLGSLPVLLGLLGVSELARAQQTLPVLNEVGILFPIPKNGIVMWSGDATTIPTGWQLCDGTNGTPDLRDRFVRGSQAPGATGGSNAVLLSAGSMPEHGHTFTTGAGGVHNHVVEDHYRPLVFYFVDGGYAGECGAAPLGGMPSTLDQGGGHSHTGQADVAGWASPAPYDNRPAYYKLAFIQRMQ